MHVWCRVGSRLRKPGLWQQERGNRNSSNQSKTRWHELGLLINLELAKPSSDSKQPLPARPSARDGDWEDAPAIALAGLGISLSVRRHGTLTPGWKERWRSAGRGTNEGWCAAESSQAANPKLERPLSRSSRSRVARFWKFGSDAPLSAEHRDNVDRAVVLHVCNQFFHIWPVPFPRLGFRHIAGKQSPSSRCAAKLAT